jgi:peroxiredoxin
MAKEKEIVNLKEGDAALDFSAMATGGPKMSLSDLKGKNVISFCR